MASGAWRNSRFYQERDQAVLHTVGAEHSTVLAGDPTVGAWGAPPILDEATVSQQGTPGTDLTLTIDAGLQLRGLDREQMPDCEIARKRQSERSWLDL